MVDRRGFARAGSLILPGAKVSATSSPWDRYCAACHFRIEEKISHRVVPASDRLATAPAPVNPPRLQTAHQVTNCKAENEIVFSDFIWERRQITASRPATRQ
jgi:hypothetical protein